MRRFASAAVIAATAYFLIATSAPPCTSTAESVMLTARTSCGPDTLETVSITSSCDVTLSDPVSGLPTTGSAFGGGGSLLSHNVFLTRRADAGGTVDSCTLNPNDAGTGFDVTCNSTCTADAGCLQCTGTLAP